MNFITINRSYLLIKWCIRFTVCPYIGITKVSSSVVSIGGVDFPQQLVVHEKRNVV